MSCQEFAQYVLSQRFQQICSPTCQAFKSLCFQKRMPTMIHFTSWLITIVLCFSKVQIMCYEFGTQRLYSHVSTLYIGSFQFSLLLRTARNRHMRNSSSGAAIFLCPSFRKNLRESKPIPVKGQPAIGLKDRSSRSPS